MNLLQTAAPFVLSLERLITIENIRRIPATEHADCVYIGRANRALHLPASPLANPFRLSPTLPREAALENYRRWLWQDIQEWGEAKDELVRLAAMARRGECVRLMCYCAPAPCHGDIVKRAILWMASDNL